MKPEDVIIRESHEPLVQLDPAEFDLVPQYFKWRWTTDSSVWLRETIIQKLREIKAMLPKGWNIRIWDAWRPLELQAKLYEDCLRQLREKHSKMNDNEIKKLAIGYLHPPTTNPAPPHSTGGTVDLTLVDEKGEALNFGTAFDDFTERANLDYFYKHTPRTKEDSEAKKNRAQLRFLMESQDFVPNPQEWWHWSYGTAQWAAAKGIEVARYGAVAPSYKVMK